MSKSQRQLVINCLLRFVERASVPSATSEEIAALPAVATILLENDGEVYYIGD